MNKNWPLEHLMVHLVTIRDGGESFHHVVPYLKPLEGLARDLKFIPNRNLVSGIMNGLIWRPIRSDLSDYLEKNHPDFDWTKRGVIKAAERKKNLTPRKRPEKYLRSRSAKAMYVWFKDGVEPDANIPLREDWRILCLPIAKNLMKLRHFANTGEVLPFKVRSTRGGLAETYKVKGTQSASQRSVAVHHPKSLVPKGILPLSLDVTPSTVKYSKSLVPKDFLPLHQAYSGFELRPGLQSVMALVQEVVALKNELGDVVPLDPKTLMKVVKVTSWFVPFKYLEATVQKPMLVVKKAPSKTLALANVLVGVAVPPKNRVDSDKTGVQILELDGAAQEWHANELVVCVEVHACIVLHDQPDVTTEGYLIVTIEKNVTKPVKRKLAVREQSPVDPSALTAKKTKNGKTKYLTNEFLLEELRLSREQDKMTDNLAKAFKLLAERVSWGPRYRGYSFREDLASQALLNLVRSWRVFNPEKGTNAFAYFTTACTRTFLHFMHLEKEQANIREDLKFMHGAPASTNRQLEAN